MEIVTKILSLREVTFMQSKQFFYTLSQIYSFRNQTYYMRPDRKHFLLCLPYVFFFRNSPVCCWISHAWSSFHPLVSRSCASASRQSQRCARSVSTKRRSNLKAPPLPRLTACPSERKHESSQGKCFGEKRGNRHSELWGLLSGVGLRSLVLLFCAGSQRSGFLLRGTPLCLFSFGSSLPSDLTCGPIPDYWWVRFSLETGLSDSKAQLVLHV